MDMRANPLIAITALISLLLTTPIQAMTGKHGEGMVVHDRSEEALEPMAPESELYPDLSRETSVGTRRGDMDIHFGNDLAGPGISSYRFNVAAGDSRDDRALGIIALPNGGSFVVGRAGVLTQGNRTGTRLAFMQLRPDGRAESSFGPSGNGRQVLDLLPSFDNIDLDLQWAQGLVVDLGALGGIVRFYLLGNYRYTTAVDDDVDFAVVCMGIASTGPNAGLFEPCPNFGGTTPGLRLVNFDNGTGFRTDVPNALHLDTRGTINDWRILVAGSAQRNDGGSVNVDMAIARLDLMTGVQDTSFAGDGRLTVAVDLITGGGDAAYSVLVKPNGKILVGGQAATSLSSDRAVLLQLLPSGALDFAFCALNNADCDSPDSLRFGRRGWNDDPSGNLSASQVSALAFELKPTDPAAVVVRTRGIGTQRAGAVSRVHDTGGCGGILCSTAVLGGFERVLPVAAVADDTGVVVATHGEISGNPLSNTHVFRVTMPGVVTLDQTFTSISPFPRQDWDVPTSDASARISRPNAIVRDGKGRYLIAGWHRTALAQNNNSFLIARLQNDVIFEHGFDYGGPPMRMQE